MPFPIRRDKRKPPPPYLRILLSIYLTATTTVSVGVFVGVVLNSKETRLTQAQVDISQVLWVKNIGVEKSDKGQCSLLFFVEP